MLRPYLCCLALLAPLPSLAQDMRFEPIHTQACMDESLDFAQRLACIGASANQCMETTAGGYSTVAQMACVGAELAWWDARLNANYQAARARAKEFDQDQMQGANAVSVATSLRDMQRAWIAFRDAKCVYERSQWGGGTGGGVAEVWCQLYATAQQSMELEPVEEGAQ